MDLFATLTADLKNAMKSGDVPARETIRSLRGAIKNAEINSGSVLQEDEALQVIQKAAKQRKESIHQYEEAGREDLAENERIELTIIEKYLPEQISEEKIDQIIRGVIEETGAAGMADMGKVMGEIMPLVRGKVDGSIINQKVKNILSET